MSLPMVAAKHDCLESIAQALLRRAFLQGAGELRRE